jgi:hypothetical protein
MYLVLSKIHIHIDIRCHVKKLDPPKVHQIFSVGYTNQTETLFLFGVPEVFVRAKRKQQNVCLSPVLPIDSKLMLGWGVGDNFMRHQFYYFEGSFISWII